MTAVMQEAAQASLFDASELPPITYLQSQTLPLDERFALFDYANPHVYSALRRIALDLRRRGHKRLGIKMLTEVLRWQSMIVTTGEPYRLNNSYTSRYARLLAEREPELRDAFELRALAS